MNQEYLMRSLMFVPAHNQHLLDSSLKRDADVLLLDIEDSVPIVEKQQARDNIKAFVSCEAFYNFQGGGCSHA